MQASKPSLCRPRRLRNRPHSLRNRLCVPSPQAPALQCRAVAVLGGATAGVASRLGKAARATGRGGQGRGPFRQELWSRQRCRRRRRMMMRRRVVRRMRAARRAAVGEGEQPVGPPHRAPRGRHLPRGPSRRRPLPVGSQHPPRGAFPHPLQEDSQRPLLPPLLARRLHPCGLRARHRPPSVFRLPPLREER